MTSDLLEAESHVNAGDTSIRHLCSFKFFVWDLGVSVSVWRPTNICTPTKFGKATCLPARGKTWPFTHPEIWWPKIDWWRVRCLSGARVWIKWKNQMFSLKRPIPALIPGSVLTKLSVASVWVRAYEPLWRRGKSLCGSAAASREKVVKKKKRNPVSLFVKCSERIVVNCKIIIDGRCQNV